MRIPLSLFFLCVVSAYGQLRPVSGGEPVNGNLPMQTIGANDLIAISVYDAPELTRTVRVSDTGVISIPLLRKKIQAEGLMPSDLEIAIGNALKEEEVIVEPLVTVTITEYHSRPISVMGSVRKPITFQADAPLTLLGALARAEGLAPEAGSVILLTRFQAGEDGSSNPIVQRIPVNGLIDRAQPELNVRLTGGEEILVPAMGRVSVVGNVKKPGVFALRDAGQTTVLQMLALAEGLAPFPGKVAYIYRRAQDGSRIELPVELDSILKRQHEDLAVLEDDILYIPDNKGRRMAVTALERALTFGSTAGATALIYHP
jgi:polysaccharide export outer membrane protein